MVVLAHLKRSSVCVQKGEKISVGQAVGEVGNSGRSSEPHLHMHLAATEEKVSHGYFFSLLPHKAAS